MTTFTEDLRPLLFGGTSWYATLDETTPDYWVLWRITKSDEPAWWRELLIGAAAFARDHGVLPNFRRRIEGIALRSLSDAAGDSERRPSAAPIWGIANELIVGLYLERALSWRLLQHEPRGFGERVGEWQFCTTSGRTVFVEVKSLVEPERVGTGVYMRGVASDRLTAVLRGAYKQLPRDDRATLVVVVGSGEILSVPFGIMHGDLFQTLFGRMQITFKVLPYVEGSERVGPSFYDTFANAGKHRRLGCVAGLKVGGMDTPGLGFYVIHNPYADQAMCLTPVDFPNTRQFFVDRAGSGEELQGLHPAEQWTTIFRRTACEPLGGA
jgi:hypothetical protein